MKVETAMHTPVPEKEQNHHIFENTVQQSSIGAGSNNSANFMDIINQASFLPKDSRVVSERNAGGIEPQSSLGKQQNQEEEKVGKPKDSEKDQFINLFTATDSLEKREVHEPEVILEVMENPDSSQKTKEQSGGAESPPEYQPDPRTESKLRGESKKIKAKRSSVEKKKASKKSHSPPKYDAFSSLKKDLYLP